MHLARDDEMTWPLALSIIGLALIDTTTFGTMLIPIWLLMAPGRIRFSSVITYLVTIGIAYFVFGILLALGADWLLPYFRSLSEASPPWLGITVLITVGAVLIAVGAFLLIHRHKRGSGSGANRIAKWRDRAVTKQGSVTSLARLAILAFVLEITTVLPYLAAIGLLVQSNTTVPEMAISLGVYCVIMISPAFVLALLRVFSHERIAPLLSWLNQWMSRNSSNSIGWISAIIGAGVIIYAVTS